MGKQKITSKKDFSRSAEDFWKHNQKPDAYGIGVNYLDSESNIIATKWLSVNVRENMGTLAAFLTVIGGVENVNKGNVDMIKAADELLSDYLHVFKDDTKYHPNIEALKYLRSLGEEKNLAQSLSPAFVLYPTESRLLEKPIEDIKDAHFRLALTANKVYEDDALYTNNLLEILPILVWTKEAVFTQSDWDQIENKESYGEASIGKFPPPNWTETLKK